MSIARSIVSVAAALLLLVTAGAGAAAQIAGETWTSPTYGFSVSWAGTEWQPNLEGMLTAAGPERLDRLHLLNGTSSLYFEGATRYEGDLSSCVAQEANLLSQEGGVSEIRPYLDEDGVQLVADGPDSSAAAFTLTLAVGDQEVELVDYVECRTLIPGEAVLIVTLVTEPNVFETELASAQEIVATIELGEEPGPDPLAAYGGWLAAAQAEASVSGPLSGELAFGPDELAVERAGVDTPDFYARVEFFNPEPATLELWDFGLGFRDSGGEEQLRLVVDAAGAWFLKDGLGPVIAGGTLTDVDASAGGSNIIELVAVGDTGYFAFNERLVSELDLESASTGGDIFVGAGFFTEDAVDDGTTAFSQFEIWSLAGVEPTAATVPTIAIDAESFNQLADAAAVEQPLAGPAAGELLQDLGAAAVAPAGVDVENFLASVAFANPSDASERPWDFGIAFREQASGDHYRLTIASDGSWEYQIGLQTDLAGGTVPSLSFEEGAINTLELVVAGDTAGFAVNGAFVSELDTSELEGASDVWVGAGFHQANMVEGVATRFQDFTVWPVDAALAAMTPAPQATPAAPAATPVASGSGVGQQLALRLSERDDSGIDALTVLSEDAAETTTTITIAARGAAGGEVIVVHRGTCDEISTLPAFLLEDLDESGQSETTIDAPLSELQDEAHAIAIHRGAEEYADVVACGDIPGAA
jgi:hypothetical protein